MTVYYITADTIGRGSDELGAILMPAYMHALTEVEQQLPSRMIFVNSGVMLVAEGSPVLDSLKVLQGRGVDIVACGTCVNYYDLKDNMRVGSVTNAADITASLLAADKVVTL